MRRNTYAYRDFIRQRLADSRARRDDFVRRMKQLKEGDPSGGLILTYDEALAYFNFLDECCDDLASEEAKLRGLLSN